MRAPFQDRSALGQEGFTLLEMVLVVFILGMVMAIAFPRITNVGGGDLKVETRTLIGHIQGLYGEAALTSKRHRLVFDLDAERYWAEVERNGEYTRVSHDFLKPVSLPVNIRLTDVITAGTGKKSEGTAYTHFYPLGRVDFTTIHLEERDGDTITLEVNPVSGKVTLLDGYVEHYKG